MFRENTACAIEAHGARSRADDLDTVRIPGMEAYQHVNIRNKYQHVEHLEPQEIALHLKARGAQQTA